MGECLARPEMMAGVIRVDLSDQGKKDGCGIIHFSTNKICLVFLYKNSMSFL